MDKSYGDPTPASTAYIGLIGVIIFVLVIIYLMALYYSTAEQVRIETVERVTPLLLEKVRGDQRAALEGYGYDHAYANETGRVTIPIDDAAQKLLDEWPNPQHPPVEATEPGDANETPDDQGANGQ